MTQGGYTSNSPPRGVAAAVLYSRCRCGREASATRGATICFCRAAMDTKAEQYRLQENNDKIARWLLGDNAAEGTVRLLVLTVAYIVSSVLVLDWLLR